MVQLCFGYTKPSERRVRLGDLPAKEAANVIFRQVKARDAAYPPKMVFQFIADLKLPLYQRDSVHFYDLCMALAFRAYTNAFKD